MKRKEERVQKKYNSSDVYQNQIERNLGNQSSKQAGSKNLKCANELLKFSYEQENFQNSVVGQGQVARKFRSALQYSFGPNSKSCYVKTKYRFVVNNGRVPNIYQWKSQQLDQQLDWEEVNMVEFTDSHDITCPICLNESTSMLVPQITKCGHIFCFPCILKHVNVSKNKFRCPLCNEFFAKNDIKKVNTHIMPPLIPGEKITFQLVVRHKDKTEIQDYESGECLDQFQRIYQNNNQKMKDIYIKDIQMLESFIQECTNNEETQDIAYAIEAISICQQRILKINQQDATKDKETQDKLKQQIITDNKDHQIEYDKSSQMQQNSKQFLLFPQQYYFMYQECNGQLIYLHPLNHKYIQTQYGQQQKLPSIISANIVNIDCVTLADQIRQRYKFLSHLPEQTDIKFVDINMDNILKSEILSNFNKDMKDYRYRCHQRDEENERIEKSKQIKKRNRKNDNQDFSDICQQFVFMQTNDQKDISSINYPSLTPMIREDTQVQAPQFQINDSDQVNQQSHDANNISKNEWDDEPKENQSKQIIYITNKNTSQQQNAAVKVKQENQVSSLSQYLAKEDDQPSLGDYLDFGIPIKQSRQKCKGKNKQHHQQENNKLI